MVVLLGNLGADPEVRELPSGGKVVNLRVATSDRRKEGDTWAEVTEWHSVVVFGKTADVVADRLRKGETVHVVGSIRTQTWTDKEGAKKYKTEVVARDVTFVGRSRAEPKYDGFEPPF
jgi:single-strand DNA-binding protein